MQDFLSMNNFPIKKGTPERNAQNVDKASK